MVLPDRVLAGGDDLYMVRIAADAVAAQVVALHLVGNLLVLVVLVGDAVYDPLAVSRPSLPFSVAVGSGVPFPLPAASLFVDSDEPVHSC